MKITDILNLASTYTGLINPVVGAGIALINKFISDKEDVKEKSLPENSTVNDIKNFLDNIPTKYSEQIKQMEVDLKLDDNFTQRYIAMCNADNQETRAKIALQQSRLVVFIVVTFTIILCVSMILQYKINADLWTVFAVLIGTPSTTILSYFGNLRKEQSNRLGIKNNTFLEKLNIK